MYSMPFKYKICPLVEGAFFSTALSSLWFFFAFKCNKIKLTVIFCVYCHLCRFDTFALSFAHPFICSNGLFVCKQCHDLLRKQFIGKFQRRNHILSVGSLHMDASCAPPNIKFNFVKESFVRSMD